jgi:tetratricopeptide (TPR) repeat protein
MQEIKFSLLKKRPKKLSVIFLLMLGFLVYSQQSIYSNEDEKNTEHIIKLISNLYDFSDSTLYYHRIDSAQVVNNQLINDSTRCFYQTILNYCKAQLEIEKKHYFKAEPILEANVNYFNSQAKNNYLKIYYNLTFQWLGEIKKSQGKYQEAIEAFSQSIFYEEGAPYSIASTEKLIGETYALQEDWKNALLYYRRSIQRLRAFLPKAKIPQDRIETQKRLIRGYEALATYFRVHQQLDSVQFYLDLRGSFLAKAQSETLFFDVSLFL